MARVRLLPLLVSLCVVGAASGAASAARIIHAVKAASVQTAVSSNWAGYVDSFDTTAAQTTSFSTVTGSWVQPSAKCSSTTPAPTSSAFWVGLGGNSEGSTALEQTGTESDCTGAGAATYSAWYELVPAASVKVKLVVEPGDTIAASIGVAGTKVTVELNDVTRGTTFSKTLTMAQPDTSSAEWIAEAPSLCSSSSVCSQSSLTDFGTVKFSKATATSDGVTGGISDPAWTPTAVQLVAAGDGRGGFDRFAATEATPAEALPTALQTNGSAFSVTWKAESSAPVSGGYGGGGYGRGGYGGGGGNGYGGGGYGGY
jgi:hypothetical protein